MKRRIERDPVGFAAVIRACLLAVLALAVAFGWKPDVDALTTALIGVAGAVELGSVWWVRGLVTPDVKVAEKVEEAKYVGAVEHQALSALVGPQEDSK